MSSGASRAALHGEQVMHGSYEFGRAVRTNAVRYHLVRSDKRLLLLHETISIVYTLGRFRAGVNLHSAA